MVHLFVFEYRFTRLKYSISFIEPCGSYDFYHLWFVFVAILKFQQRRLNLIDFKLIFASNTQNMQIKNEKWKI